MKLKTNILTCLVAAGVFACASLHAEEPKPGSEAPAVHNKSLFEQIKEGGWVMIPIGACSVLTLYLIGDGIIRVTNPTKLLPRQHVRALRQLFRDGRYPEAYKFCKANPSAFTNICRVAVSQL